MICLGDTSSPLLEIIKHLFGSPLSGLYTRNSQMVGPLDFVMVIEGTSVSWCVTASARKTFLVVMKVIGCKNGSVRCTASIFKGFSSEFHVINLSKNEQN